MKLNCLILGLLFPTVSMAACVDSGYHHYCDDNLNVSRNGNEVVYHGFDQNQTFTETRVKVTDTLTMISGYDDSGISWRGSTYKIGNTKIKELNYSNGRSYRESTHVWSNGTILKDITLPNGDSAREQLISTGNNSYVLNYSSPTKNYTHFCKQNECE